MRLLFPFLAGIAAALSFEQILPILLLITGLLLPVLLLLMLSPLSGYKYSARWMTGLFILVELFLLAYQFVSNRVQIEGAEEITRNREGWFVGEITEAISVRKGIIRSVVTVRYFHSGGKWSPICGKSIFCIKPDSSHTAIQYGDCLLFRASFQKVEQNNNPGSFNYARYLKNRGIQYTVWLQPGDWKLLPVKTTNPLKKISFNLRTQLLDRIRSSDLDGDEFAVAAALLLGYTDELGSGLRNSYAATGVTHILSVSGMHVGIIFLFLEFILGFLNRSRTGRLLKILLMMLFIWFYAFLTGFSPAVLRAAAMLSFIIICRSLKRAPELLNILAASLFFLLVYNPLLILDLGFQLSYLAVAGITLAYQPIYGMIRSDYRIVQKLWAVLAVTLAAQIATTPLSLYYFHQFPNYFLLTNLVVVPFSSMIIYAGIAVVGFSFIPGLTVLSAKILSFLVWTLNFFIQVMERLPAATSRGIFISWFEMVLLYLALSSLLLFLYSREKRWLFLFLASCILLSSSSLNQKIRRLGRESFTVYNFRNMTAVEFSSEERVVLIYEPVDLRRVDELLASTLNEAGNSWSDRGVHRKTISWYGGGRHVTFGSSDGNPVWRRGMFFQFCGRRVGILRESLPKGFSGRITLDYLVISGNPRTSIEEILKIFSPGKLIIDGTNARARVAKWCTDAARAGIPCFPVTRMGAMVEEF